MPTSYNCKKKFWPTVLFRRMRHLSKWCCHWSGNSNLLHFTMGSTHHPSKEKNIARCYQLLHSFRSKNIWTYKKAFVTYVRPVLEANTVVWCPYLKKDVIAVEKVQEKFFKAICRRCNVRTRTYYERLNALDIETLEYRRHKFDVIMVFKIIHELVDVDFNDFFSFSNTPYNLRRHRFHIEGVKCNSNTRKHFFANRIVNIWNGLPSTIVESSSLETFRRRLNTFNLRSIQKMVY